MHNIKQYKLCRRLGAALFEKCQTATFLKSQEKKTVKKGPQKRKSDYGVQLIDKQRVRFMYGVMEKQFKNYVNKATLTQKPAKVLFEILESRIDNIIYRAGLAKTRRMARQMVSHGHFMVNGHKTKVPSYLLSSGDVIEIRKGSENTNLFTELEGFGKSSINWLTIDVPAKRITVKGCAVEPDPFLNFQTVVEFYSR
jgi:small subunit ribosomal protein S4